MALTLQNKVDLSSMNEQEQKAFKLYGKVPAKNLLTKMQKDRKYFDSGDYMMNKAGVGNQPLGTAIPTPEGLPHAQGGLSSSPTGSTPSLSPGLNEGGNGATGAASPPPAGSANAQAQPIGVPGASPPTGFLQHRGSVGVGISTPNVDVPIPQHARRPSESHRISPPGTLNNPSSSFPIERPGGFGSSPVKASSLARRIDTELEAVHLTE